MQHISETEALVGNSLSQKEHAKNILKKALPLILMSASDIGGQFIRTYIISQLGNKALDSTLIIYDIVNFIVLPIPLLTMQDAVIISEKFGQIKAAQQMEGDMQRPTPELINPLYSEIGSFVRQGWLLAFCTSIPSVLLLSALHPFIIKCFNQPSDIENLAKSYILPFSFGLPLQFMLTISERFLSAVDQEIWIIPYRLLNFGVEVGLNYFFILHYSLAGAAYAQILKNIFAAACLFLFFKFKTEFKRFNIYKRGLGNTTYIKKVLTQGWPMMFTQFLNVGIAFLITMFVGNTGPGRLGLEQIIIQYFGLIAAINSGISESANRIVSQYFGGKKFQDMRQAGNISIKMNILIYSIPALFVNIFSKSLASVFLSKDNQPENINELIYYNFIIMNVVYLMNVIQGNCKTNLSAVEDTAFSSWTSLISYATLILPLAALATYRFNLDFYGVTSSILIGMVPLSAITLWYWLSHSRKLIESKDHPILTSNQRLEKSCQNRCRFYKSFQLLQESEISTDSRQVTSNVEPAVSAP